MLVTNARLITVPAGSDDPGYIEHGWMHVVGDMIAALGAGDAPAGLDDEVLDVAGAFVAPGFVSTHSHLFTSATRGLGVAETLYGWCDSMLGIIGRTGPQEIYWTTFHGSLDFLDHGVTTAYDFTDPRIPWEPMVEGRRQVIGQPRPLEYQLAQIDAKAHAGLRFVNSIPMDDAVGTDDEILDRFGAAVAHVRGIDPALALGAAVTGSVQWSNRPDAAAIEREAMRRFGVINQAHFLETREAVDVQRSKFALYRDAGILGEGLIFGHFIQTTPEIIAEAAAGGAGMSWQPASNGRLASGTADLPTILASGMTVGMGLDDQACTDIADPWQNMRMGMFSVRAETGRPTDMMPETVLRLHTIGGAELLGVADRVGSLEVGKFADFLVVDPTEPDVGPLWHPVRNYVLSCGPRNLTQVWVGGRLVSAAGRSTHPQAAEVKAKVRESLEPLAERFGHPV